MTFAFLQVKAIWSVLLRRFELELIDPNPQPNYTTFVVGPRPPCRVRFRRKLRTVVNRSGPLVHVTADSARLINA
jgi:sterol 14-demethylase